MVVMEANVASRRHRNRVRFAVSWQTAPMSTSSISPRRPRSLSAVAVATTVVALLAGCGGSASKSGETVIEERLADEIALGDLEATCNEPDDLSDGETFTCTATTEDGTEIEFLGTMTSDDEFEIVTTNLLTADDVTAIRSEGARVLSEEIGAEITPDDITCPTEIVVLDDTGDFECAITDTSTGEVYDLTISTGGLTPGVGVNELFFQVGELQS